MSKNKLPTAVLFDFNGTLNDMSVVMEQDIYVARQEFGVELSSDEVVAAWGQTADKLFPQLFGKNGDPRPWQKMQEIFDSHSHRFPRKLLPDVVETISLLKQHDIKTGIVTSGKREKVIHSMGQMGLSTDLFDLIHTGHEIGSDIEAKRPILARALGELSLEHTPGAITFVGDEAVTKADAQAVGADYVVVASGTVDRGRLLRQGIPRGKLINQMSELPGKLGLPDA